MIFVETGSEKPLKLRRVIERMSYDIAVELCKLSSNESERSAHLVQSGDGWNYIFSDV